MLPFLVLIACAAAICWCCEWFVNGVEWLGWRWNVGRMAVGTVLAAVGTALPESVVTLVAVTAQNGTADVGIGAAMGGPLVLATLAYGVTGVALLHQQRKTRSLVTAAEPPPNGNRSRQVRDLARDQRWFIAVFAVKVVLGLVAFSIKPWLGFGFFAVYAIYFRREMRKGRAEGNRTAESLPPLKFQPRSPSPSTATILVQTVASVTVIFVASQLFVGQLGAIGPMLGLPSTVTAVLLSPIATELPEITNAIIWVRKGTPGLALANISGSMMIQATVPSGFGLLFTGWRFDGALIWSGAITLTAVLCLLVTLQRNVLTPGRLALAGGLYLVFALGLVPLLS